MRFSPPTAGYGTSCRADAPDHFYVHTATPPTQLRAIDIGGLSNQDSLGRMVEVATLEHVRTVACGTRARAERSAGWSSNSLYSVLVDRAQPTRPRIVVLVTSGFGPRLVYLNQLALADTMLPMLDAFSDVALWDLLHTLVDCVDGAYLQGRARERKRWQLAAAEKRITVRKERNASAVTVSIKRILPAPSEGRAEMVIAMGGEMPGEHPWEPLRAASANDSVVRRADQPLERATT